MMTFPRLLNVLAGLTIAISTLASAEKVRAQGAEEWEFSLAPYYLWAVSMDGDATVKGLTTNVDASFGDIFDQLEFVITGHAEAKKGDWTVFFDGTYLELGIDESEGPVSIDLDVTMALVELGGTYRFYEIPQGGGVEALAGFRYTYMDNEIDFTPGSSGDADESWVDPFVGLRAFIDLSEKITLSLRGDVGGFGVGSDFTANGLALLGYQPRDWINLVAGYRVLYQDYSDGSGANEFAWDMTMHGPMLGVEFKF